MFYTEESTNQYLNDNWRPVSDALKPIIAKTIEDILLGILYKVFNYVPADYLVSDIAKPSELYKTEQWTHPFLNFIQKLLLIFYFLQFVIVMTLHQKCEREKGSETQRGENL